MHHTVLSWNSQRVSLGERFRVRMQYSRSPGGRFCERVCTLCFTVMVLTCCPVTLHVSTSSGCIALRAETLSLSTALDNPQPAQEPSESRRTAPVLGRVFARCAHLLSAGGQHGAQRQADLANGQRRRPAQ